MAGGSDADLEGIVLEFNVRVANQLGINSGALLGCQRPWKSSTVWAAPRATRSSRTSSNRASTASIKQVVGFDPNPAGTTGTATVQLSFTQNCGSPAFDTQVTDGFASGSNYSLVSVTINGATLRPGKPPSRRDVQHHRRDQCQFRPTGCRRPGASTLPSDPAQRGGRRQRRCHADLEQPVGNFTSWAATASASTVHRRRAYGSDVGPNPYILRDNAGLGVISGTLWNDTVSADRQRHAGWRRSYRADRDPDLGRCRRTLDTTADNLSFSTATDANGQYHFGVLPLGVFRIDVPAGLVSYPQPLGDLRVRVDSDASTLGQVAITLGDADSKRPTPVTSNRTTRR